MIIVRYIHIKMKVNFLLVTCDGPIFSNDITCVKIATSSKQEVSQYSPFDLGEGLKSV